MKFLKLFLLLVVLLIGAVLALAWNVGAWNSLFPSAEHDTEAPWLPSDLGSPALLVFSKTNGFRHKEGIAGGAEALRDIATGRGWDVFATENGAVFNATDLQRFATVVFLNASGDMLSPSQEQTFKTWLEAGGGWVGIHAAGDGSHTDWPWYVENLIGTEFTAHIFGPQFQRATVVMESPEHPVVQRLPNIWSHTEEWYSWKQSPRANDFTILAVLDEGSYSPVQKILGREKDLRMGDHPVVWTHCVGKGRTLYTALGHTTEAFESAEYRILLEDALHWTMGAGEGC
jgi:type 1 glutamine amidotransferase